jgi:hypothetical protein
MAKKPKTNSININSSGAVNIGGDIVGRDKITRTNNVAVTFEQEIKNWGVQAEHIIDASSLPADEKSDAKKQVNTIQETILSDKSRNPSRIEKLINTLAIMSPDIFDIIVASLASPLTGIGLVIKKINDKAKIEVTAK